MSYRKKHIHPKIKGLRKNRHILKSPVFWIIFFVALVGCGVFYFVLFSSVFQISNITISGNQKLANADIQNAVLSHSNQKIVSVGFLQIWSKNILIISTDALTGNLLKEFPRIESVLVQKNLPKSLTIKIKEREPYAVFCDQSNHCFLLDKNGAVGFKHTGNITNDLLRTKILEVVNK